MRKEDPIFGYEFQVSLIESLITLDSSRWNESNMNNNTCEREKESVSWDSKKTTQVNSHTSS